MREDCCMKVFIEQQILGAVRGLLTGRVNELLGDMEFSIPAIEFYGYSGGGVVVPVVALFSCERSEKERIIRLDAYSLSITFTLIETPESELYCYAYADAVCKAVNENPTLGGVADRAVISGKKYLPPKKAIGGNEWEITISLRVTIENEK
jgi:hypothetical protein